MHGKGTFYDPRLDDASQIPDRGTREIWSRACRRRPDHATTRRRCMIYQLALDSAESHRTAATTRHAAKRGAKRSSMDKANCAHPPRAPLFTEPGWNMHTAEEMGIDDLPVEPLRRMSGIERHQFAARPLDAHQVAASTTTADSNARRGDRALQRVSRPGLSSAEQRDLEQYLRSPDVSEDRG